MDVSAAVIVAQTNRSNLNFNHIIMWLSQLNYYVGGLFELSQAVVLRLSSGDSVGLFFQNTAIFVFFSFYVVSLCH